MMAAESVPLFEQTYIQYGFAGFCFVLIGLIIWLINKQSKREKESTAALINVIEKNNSIVAKSIDALGDLKANDKLILEELGKYRTEAVSVRIALAKRPCLQMEDL